MKRLTCWILMVVLLLTAIPAMAADTRTSGLYTYEIKGNGTVSIVDFDWVNNSEDIYIPNMLDGYTVTSIEAGAFAFSGSDWDSPAGWNYYILTIPNTVTSIKRDAFKFAPLKLVSIPESVQLIEEGAFYGSYRLEQFNVAPNNKSYASIDGVLYEKSTKTLLAYPMGKNRGEEGYAPNMINIPEGIKRIGAYACYGTKEDHFYNIRGVRQPFLHMYGDCLPSSIESIGDYAFCNSEVVVDTEVNCDYLLRSHIEKIGAYAFMNATFDCRGTEERTLHFTPQLKEIGEGTFYQTEFQADHGVKLCINETVTSIPDYAFYHYQTEFDVTLQLHNSIESIGAYAFEGAAHDDDYGDKGIINALSGFESGQSWESVGEGAFSGRWFLDDELVISGTCSVISANAFSNCLNVHNIVIEEGVTEIGEGAFSGLYVSEISLPISLKTIKKNAFASCNRLTSITIPENVTSIAIDAFDRTKIVVVVAEGSYAALWAQENAYSYKYIGQTDEDLSWLTGGSETEGTTEDTSWLNN